jgi:hypothetical protein
LEGHLTETNYGADWGDVVSFTARMRAKAKELGVDLLVVDTGTYLPACRLGVFVMDDLSLLLLLTWGKSR